MMQQRWLLTQHHILGVGNTYTKKEHARVENYPPLGVSSHPNRKKIGTLVVFAIILKRSVRLRNNLDLVWG